MKTVMGIDPGETTGICTFNVFEDLSYRVGIQATVEDYHNIDNMMDSQGVDLIIMEDFRLYRHMARRMINNSFVPVQVIGAVKYMAEKRNIPVVLQMAAVTKFITAVGTTNNPHIQSAYKHTIAYLKRLEKDASLDIVGIRND